MLATLKVTPWSALRTIDLGYDGGDGGVLDLEKFSRDGQHVTSVVHLALAKEGLKVWCSSHNPSLKSLDFGGFASLETVESYFGWEEDGGLVSIGLEGAASLKRLCLENNDLASLDISDCVELEDLRGAMNAYTSISWPNSMLNLWHVCVRDNPQFAENVPVGSMPAIRECYLWNDSQSGEFAPSSSDLVDVQIYDNKFTSINLAGARFGTGSQFLDASESASVVSVRVGSSGVRDLVLSNDGLATAAIAALLSDLNASGVEYGSLNLAGNPGDPEMTSAAYLALVGKGWTITH
jgi:hypothetical protein